MPQQILSDTELLDGGQIRNKLYGALKSGQTEYTSEDLQCYDIGQIQTKYNMGLIGEYATAPSTRLPASSGYFKYLSLKYGGTVSGAYSGTYSSYAFIDIGFNGLQYSFPESGDKLYTLNIDNALYPVSEGYYMNSSNQWYYVSGIEGIIGSTGQYDTSYALEKFDYLYSSAYSTDPISNGLGYLNSSGWNTILGSIYQKSSNSFWYDSYNSSTGTWGGWVNGLFIKEHAFYSLRYRALRITSGNYHTEETGYKQVSFYVTPVGSSSSSSGSGLTDWLIEITSTVYWRATITVGSGYASFTTGGGQVSQVDGEGSSNLYLKIDANSSYSSRTITITVVDIFGEATGWSHQITQDASVLTPNSINLRYSSITAQDAAAQTLSNTYYYYGTFGTGTTLYTNSTASNYAPSGFYMNPTNRVYWFIGGTNGYISSTAVYYSGIDLFTYCHYSTSQTLEQAVAYATNNNLWGTSAGTIRKNGDDNKWYSGYDSTTGLWSNLVTGVYIQSNSTHGALVYDYKNISNGVATEGMAYKNPTLTLSYDTGYMSSDGGTRTISVTSGVKWQAIITSGNASISGNNWGDGSGSFIVSVGENTGSPRDISFTVLERAYISGVSSKYGTFRQLEPAGSYVAVPYYGFLSYDLFAFDLSEDKNNCYYSGNSGTLYYSAGQYYRDTSLTLYANYGMYMLYQGVYGYPTFSDSEFLILD